MVKLPKNFHNLSIRYKLFFPLIVVIVIITTSQFIVRFSESHTLELTNNWVNIAGRNRMLAMRVLHLSQQLSQGDEAFRRELNIAKEQVEQGLQIMQIGGELRIDSKTISVATPDESLQPVHKNLVATWNKYNQQVSQISNGLFEKYSKTQQQQIVLKAYQLNDRFITNSNLIIERMTTVSQVNHLRMKWIQRGILASNIFILLIVIYIFWKYTFKPLHKLSEVASNMALGNLDEVLDINQKDEIGRIAEATKDLAYNLKEVREFVQHLGEGNYGIQLEMEKKGRKISKDSLFMTMIVARDRLRSLMKENERQAWVSKGLAEFGNTLSAGDTDLKELCDTLISQLVRYLKGNQGGIFVLEELENDEKREKWLELISCYGFSEERYQKRRLLIDNDFGAGLVGQALIEMGTIHQVGIMSEYFGVTLGMGDVDNGNVLIVPLVFNQKEVGAIEIGSFTEFTHHEIEFIEILADRIASTILNIQASAKTNILLKYSEEQKDILQAQEEEMRQNVEELIATQEAMGKKQKELELQNQRIKSSELVLKKALKQLEEQKVILEEQKYELEEANDILHAQEEEMRQNMEELIATQEALALKGQNLERQNKLITTSIYYAQNIQQAILPSREKLLNVLKGGFVIYRPKDIVSGDFYWMSKIKDRIIVAAVDCTGHGVPGAFMSMIGNTLLNQIVNEKKVTDPADILRLLDKSVYEDLNQQKSSNREGMDVCLCTIEYENGHSKVLYAGAKRGLYYLNEGEIKEQKGDRYSIGGWQANKEKVFCTKELILNKADRLYLSSDGFVDTPNPKRKSLGTKRFRMAL